MKMLISACAADNGKSGVGQYMRATVAGLLSAAPDSVTLDVYVNAGDQSLFEQGSDRLQIRALSRFWSTPLANLIWHLLVLPFIAIEGKYNVALFLAANRRLSWIPYVTTVGVTHDLSQLHVTGKYGPFRTFYVLKILTRLMSLLDKVVCVSHSTARDLVKNSPVAAKKISVIHNGADLQAFRNSDEQIDLEEKFNIRSPYLLYTARLEHPGKNHVRLLEAFDHFNLRSAARFQLVLVGSRWNGAEAIDKKIQDLGLENKVIQTGFVAQSELVSLVRNATIFVFPSLYEGFGIPLLEAMAAGTPVCAANTSSIPEVLGDAGLMFDPTDPQDMAEVLLQFSESPEFAGQFIRRGRLRVAEFTWERSATLLFAACRAACSDSHG